MRKLLEKSAEKLIGCQQSVNKKFKKNVGQTQNAKTNNFKEKQ